MPNPDSVSFVKMLERNRVIPAIRNERSMAHAIKSANEMVFVLYGDILTLDKRIEVLLKNNKKPFIHLDLIQGLANNPVVLEYLFRNFAQECGVITTKSHMTQKAIDMGIRVVQRYFMLDSLSLEGVIEGITKVAADAIEIMPGVLPEINAKIRQMTSLPLIAGGLIQTVKELEASLASGAVAISTSKVELWSI